MMNDKIQRTLLVGVAGASGSGKSFFANLLKAQLPGRVLILSQDDYYTDRSSIPFSRRSLLNYDHPDAIDFTLFVQQLEALKAGKAIEQPLYDFRTHNRRPETRACGPADIIIVDGILIYVPPKCRDIFDIKIFIDTPADICLARRLRRDVDERGRTMDSVLQQYLETVRPMFLEHVAPTMQHADLIVAGMGDMLADVNKVQKEVMNLLAE